MPRRSRNRAEDPLARVEEKLATRRAKRMTRVPYEQRIHNERLAQLKQSLLEVARMEAEGSTLPEQLARLRWVAAETFRRGKPPSAAEYAKAHVPPSVPAAAPAEEQVHEPWRPKPKRPVRDVLADYRGNPDYQSRRWLEPEFV